MRNSCKGPVQRPSGFTLLEVILAVSLILMVIGLGLVYRFNSQEKELLRKVAGTVYRTSELYQVAEEWREEADAAFGITTSGTSVSGPSASSGGEGSSPDNTSS